MFRNHKAQINLEFMAAAGFYILALGAVVTAGSDILPQYSQEVDKSSLNLEARSLTNQLMTEEGFHSNGSGGNNWEKNTDTIQRTESIGLANDFLELNRSKIQSLETVNRNGQKMNYSSFKEITGVENQYQFKFVWMPTVQTSESFIRNSPPSSPPIEEPNTGSYSRADNRIHYGEVTLEGISYKFLVAAHDGVYDTAYVGNDWNFQGESPVQKNQDISSAPFEIYSFQNRERQPGSILILNQTINTFGANVDSDSIVTTFQRFGVMEDEPLKIEVWTW